MLLNENISPSTVKQMSLDEKNMLCAEIRSFLIDTISRTGGHLASNLGTVELTVSIHSVFNTPVDKLVFDVGHQSYTHKLLTGRMKGFEKLRTEGGISGFPRPSESIHDAFIGGHSSISIAAASGIARAMKLKGEKGYAIAIIGDGALTGGEVYEGFNNVDKSLDNLIIVINDNEMSISKSRGAIARYLAQMRTTVKYSEAKKSVKELLGSLNKTGTVQRSISRTKSILKYAIYKNNLFENLGFKYFGPVDGHNIADLIEAFQAAKLQHEPVVIHTVTKKGMGYTPAEQNSGQYHGVDRLAAPAKGMSYSETFGRELLRLAVDDDRICAVSAAMKYATGCNFLNKSFPERFFDVGIAEGYGVTFCSALASQGLLPVYAIYSTFLQRGYDQLIHDAAIEKYHIVLAVDRAGLVGEDGETHHGVFDVSMLSSVPGSTIYSPYTSGELKGCLSRALYEDEGIVAVRYPKGTAVQSKEQDVPDYRLFGGGKNILAITYGRLTGNAVRLTDKGADVLQLIKIHPISDKVISLIKKYKRVYFFEEGEQSGGIGQQLGERLLEGGFSGQYSLTALDDSFVRYRDLERQLKGCGMDFDSMNEKINGKAK